MATALSQQLKQTLATAFSFYLKAHNFHWNVVGPNFSEYHKFLNEVYDQVWEDVDKYAEHIRALDDISPGSYREFMQLTKIADSIAPPSAMNMMITLANDNDIVRDQLRQTHALAEEAGEFGVLNFIEDRLDYHDKLHWMLTAFGR